MLPAILPMYVPMRLVFGIGVSGKLRVVLGVVFGIAFVVCAKYTQWCVYAYRSFSYDGERKLSKQIIDGTAKHITLPEGGVGLDIGCGGICGMRGHPSCCVRRATATRAVRTVWRGLPPRAQGAQPCKD